MSRRVRVRLFAGLRERAGYGARELELADGATVGDVWPALGLGALPRGIAYAVNRGWADESTPLRDGDEVALIPPVSGGAEAEPAVSAFLSAAPLDPAAVQASVADAGAGAIASFVGTVRDRARGRRVRWLEYEAFDEMAVGEMERIAAQAARTHGCLRAAIGHRTGRVEIGEPSVVVAVAAAHRASALAACAEVIDALKQTVPIWKKELYEGGEEWVGQGS